MSDKTFANADVPNDDSLHHRKVQSCVFFSRCFSFITAKHTSPFRKTSPKQPSASPSVPALTPSTLKPNFSLFLSFFLFLLSANFRQFKAQRRRPSGSDGRVTVIGRRKRQSQTLLSSVLSPPPSAFPPVGLTSGNGGEAESDSRAAGSGIWQRGVSV